MMQRPMWCERQRMDDEQRGTANPTSQQHLGPNSSYFENVKRRRIKRKTKERKEGMWEREIQRQENKTLKRKDIGMYD